MMTDTSTPPEISQDDDAPSASIVQTLIGRISKLEIAVGAAIAALMLVLVVIEPNILEAPFENANTILFTVGGSALAGLALLAMLWFRVPPVVRVVVLVVPFAVVNWWLLSPYFIDDVVDEGFATSISAELAVDTGATTDAEDAPADDAAASDDATDDSAPVDEEAPPADTDEAPTPAEPTGPVLLGAGQFVGLAGHDGTGDAGIFENPDGSLVLRFENFDIDNGPDLKVYLVPGADQTSLAEGSIDLGRLEGNIGDQNYELPAGTELPPGDYTALVWCEAFSVEFVGATVTV